MRKYIIHYLTEVNDECVDREIEVEASGIEFAIISFRDKVRVYKRITAIIEENK